MRARSIILTVPALAVVLAGSAPTSLEAQVCLGPPARSGEVAFVGNRSTRGVTTSYGGQFQANLGGTVALGAGFSVDTFDDLAQDGFTSRLSVAVPRSFWKLSACPVLGVEYSEVTPRTGEESAPSPLNSVVLGSGVGVGAELPLAAAVSLGAHARPTLLLVFGEHARVRGGRGVADPEGPVHVGVTLGAVLRVDRLFVGVETHRTTLSGAPAALLHFGMVR